ncbi:hypothetical protein [Variovorax soli]|uniref:Uncharacterized protein n=1 Tax=Variovorax soli TaxID=376815 RepID=A0ABU1NKP1_9BURK|nr:hypothetical protein [Variovorax soli]MDR6538986.1 hypothetical protein [Variovorax soli]
MKAHRPAAPLRAFAAAAPLVLLLAQPCIAQAQAPDPTWRKSEGEDFVLAAPARVRYGAGDRWVEKVVSGQGSCSNAFFGSDPAPQVRKSCTWIATATAKAASPRLSAKGVTEVVDRAGKVLPEAYRAIAANMGDAEGIAYRYGPEPTADAAARAKLPTLYEREDQFARCEDNQRHCRTSWQVGGPRKEVDFAYSTNQSSVVFLADDPVERAGVGDLQASAFEANTYAQKPQLPWQHGGGGLDSINVVKYRAAGLLPNDGSARPIAAGRCSGPAGYCPTSVIAFQNGLLATTGSNTAHNQATARLAPNKVPTAVAMTSNSEFAFVTVWDTAQLKGQVAVVALAGLCDGCKLEGPYYEWWSEWQGVYPGLPNMGNIAFMKVLGYVDLPAEMKAPTEIAVTTGMHPFNTVLGGGLFMGQANSPLATHWRSFTRGGGNYGRYAKGGVAVVVSKSEQMAAFIDLKPLFDYINGVYFSDAVAGIGAVGQDERQWPHGFGFKPQARPVVVKTVALDARPTAVKTTLTRSKDARAWIATQEGALRIFSLGGYAPGADVHAGSPNEIQALGKVAIGRNPTSLAHSKGEPEPGMKDDPLNGQVIVTSRGDRSIQWVRFSPDGRSGRVVRTLQDSRLVDPIAAEDIDNFANVGLTLSVADYGGRAVLNYRYGPVVFADRGAQWACQPPGGCPVKPTGDIAIEFGGSFPMQGRPYQINTSNVP